MSVPAGCPCGVVDARSALAVRSSPRAAMPGGRYAGRPARSRLAARAPRVKPCVRACGRRRRPVTAGGFMAVRPRQRRRTSYGLARRPARVPGGVGSTSRAEAGADRHGASPPPAAEPVRFPGTGDAGSSSRPSRRGKAPPAHHPTLEVPDRDYCPCKPERRPAGPEAETPGDPAGPGQPSAAPGFPRGAGRDDDVNVLYLAGQRPGAPGRMAADHRGRRIGIVGACPN